jgi:hypothetical protein
MAGGGTVSFAVGKHPEHGALSDLRLLGDNRATIIYQNDPASSVARDGFSYVVKSSDRVSSPAEVTILVDEAPPKSRVPDRIEFAEVRAGESASRAFTITNAGGGMLEGRLTVSAPWALGFATYRVNPGTPASVELVFRPTEARSFVGQITLFGSDGALLGSASSPIGIEPAELRIGLPREKSEPRSGAVALTNRTERELPLKLEASSRIRPIADMVLAPGETKRIEVEIDAERRIPVHGRIAIIGPGFRLPVSVDAEAEPPAGVEGQSAAGSSAPASPAPPAATAAPSVIAVSRAQQSPRHRPRLRRRHSSPSAPVGWILPAGNCAGSSRRIRWRSIGLKKGFSL